jgi:C4-dicarboxylate-specific signal transduction histidine kinase
MVELAASIAREINQPLTAIVSNASAALRWGSPADRVVVGALLLVARRKT